MTGVRCDGCNHNWYSAPGGCTGKPFPHSRCLHFNSDIPCIVEKRVGCDGTVSKQWVASAIPADCPTYHPAQAALF